MSAATRKTRSGVASSPIARIAAAAPETKAAAEEPTPRARGTSLSTSSSKGRSPIARRAAAITPSCSRSPGRCRPRWMTDHVSAMRARPAHRGLRAMAMQSNPGPRLAVVAGADAEDQSFTSQTLSVVTVAAVGDILDFENLLPELILALGLALVIGNGLAWWKSRKGEAPKDVEDAEYR